MQKSAKLDPRAVFCYITDTLNFTPLNKAPGTPDDKGRSDLRILASCPMCQTAYHPLKTRVLAERDDAHLLYLECKQCGSSVVAIVTADPNGLQSIGAVTDLTRNELIQATPDRAITVDDVVELYDWLTNQLSVQLTLRTEPRSL